jgi:hypothetical protein
MKPRNKEIVKKLKKDQGITYVEGAFRYYIDNQIDDQDLDEILKADDYHLESSFFSSIRRDKKQYFTHEKHRITFDLEANQYFINTYPIYNRNYFFYIASKATRNKQITTDLMHYLRDLGQYNAHCLIFGLDYIKVKNLSLIQYDAVKNFVQDHDIKTLYELLTSAIIDNINNKEPSPLINIISNFFIKEENFQFDINSKYATFCIYIECALSLVDKKTANTIRFNFNVLPPNTLKEEDYYQDNENKFRSINTLKKKIKKENGEKVLFATSRYVKENQKEINEFPENGYKALYMTLMEENDEKLRRRN